MKPTAIVQVIVDQDKTLVAGEFQKRVEQEYGYDHVYHMNTTAMHQ